MADDLHYEEPKASKKPLIALCSRVLTVATLIVSIIILKNVKMKYKAGGNFSFDYKDTKTYPYSLYSMMLGFIYTCISLPFAAFYVMMGKRLINRYAFLQYEFYGDKVCLVVLSTALGALFGGTMEMKRMSGMFDTINGKDAGDYRSKMGDFCGKAYLSAIFLMVAFLSSVVSSILSSKAFSKKL